MIPYSSNTGWFLSSHCGCFLYGTDFIQYWMILTITLWMVFVWNKFHPILDGSCHIMHWLQNNHFIGHGSNMDGFWIMYKNHPKMNVLLLTIFIHFWIRNIPPHTHTHTHTHTIISSCIITLLSLTHYETTEKLRVWKDKCHLLIPNEIANQITWHSLDLNWDFLHVLFPKCDISLHSLHITSRG